MGRGVCGGGGGGGGGGHHAEEKSFAQTFLGRLSESSDYGFKLYEDCAQRSGPSRYSQRRSHSDMQSFSLRTARLKTGKLSSTLSPLLSESVIVRSGAILIAAGGARNF